MMEGSDSVHRSAIDLAETVSQALRAGRKKGKAKGPPGKGGSICKIGDPNSPPGTGVATVESILGRLARYGLHAFLLLTALLVIFCIYVIVVNFNNVRAHRKEIDSNWAKYRCNPYIMPFAGWYVGPKGAGKGMENMAHCLGGIINTWAQKLLGPVYTFLEGVLDVMWDLVTSLQSIRQMINYMRKTAHDYLYDIANLLYGIYKRLSYVVNRFKQTFVLLFRTFKKVFYAIAYGLYTIAALWNSPVGGVARFFCFRKSTPIKMKDGSYTVINQIKVGQKVASGDRVQAIMKFSGKGIPVYAYPTGDGKAVFVAGSHLVQENGKWIRVEDSYLAIQVPEEEDILYCLVTKEGKIVSGDTLFADYIEAPTEQDLVWIREHILSHLNESTKKTEGVQKANRVWGFGGDEKVQLKSGKWRKLKNLKIGDRLRVGGKVEGITKIWRKDVDVFRYRDVICTGDQVVQTNTMMINGAHGWKAIRECTDAMPYKIKARRLWNVCTEKKRLFIKGVLFTDFEQVNNEGVNTEIDQYVERMLNKGTTL